MTVITVKDQSPTEQILSSLKTWQRDAKKFKQTALYDLLVETAAHIKKQEKALNDEGKKVFEEFTRTPADAAFSNYIRARAGYRCERCGKQYKAKSTGLQCSHHFSRRHYNIRFDPDNAAALCHHCHNFWYSKDVPEAARWLENKIGRDAINALIELKNQPQTKPTASELDAIAAHWRKETEKLLANNKAA
nr:MAG TPA: NinG recombination protein [Caudoviricetes sp.]